VRLRLVTAGLGMLIGLPAAATAVSGDLVAPAGATPAMRVYAWSGNGALHWVAARAGESFRLDLPAGRYRLFAAPADPGAPPVYAGHTGCDPRTACGHHRLRWLQIDAAPLHADIGDWHLDESDATGIDERLGRSEAAPDDLDAAAPKFIEYPSTSKVGVRANRLTLDGESEPGLKQALRDALATGTPNLGGRGVLLQSPCPHACEAALVDLSTGHVLRVPHPQGTITYRRDSRLLVVSLPDASRHYYVWEPDTAALKNVRETRGEKGSEAAY
jgi:hypothetical protein